MHGTGHDTGQIDPDYLRSIAAVGHALWSKPGYASRVSVETFATVGLKDHVPDIALERAATALLRRASRNAAGMNAGRMGNAFYRLLPEERIILIGLHQLRWSYGRLARILDDTPEHVAQIAWGARLALAGPGNYPAAGAYGASCPEYDAGNPWTQRFLDEEYGHRERIFLQNHLMACEGCRRTLNRARDLYYTVEKRIPTAEEADDMRMMKRIWRDTSRAMGAGRMSFGRSLRIFFARTDVLVAVGAGLVLVFLHIAKA